MRFVREANSSAESAKTAWKSFQSFFSIFSTGEFTGEPGSEVFRLSPLRK